MIKNANCLKVMLLRLSLKDDRINRECSLLARDECVQNFGAEIWCKWSLVRLSVTVCVLKSFSLFLSLYFLFVQLFCSVRLQREVTWECAVSIGHRK